MNHGSGKPVLAAVAGAIALLVASAGIGEVGSDEALSEAVACAEIDFSLAVEERDRERFAGLIHPDARFVGGGVHRGRDAVVAAWAPFFEEDGPRLTWRPMIVEVLESGDLALSRGPYRLQSVDENGTVIEQWGTFNSTWQRQVDGSWQVVFDAGSPAPGEFPAEIRLLILEPAAACTAERPR